MRLPHTTKNGLNAKRKLERRYQYEERKREYENERQQSKVGNS